MANNDICLINKVYAPNSVVGGEAFSNTITADFDFNNVIAGTSSLKVTDLSKAAGNDSTTGTSRLELRKTVENITQGTAPTETQNQAKPGDVLKYSISYSNTGTGPITELEIKDIVPAFTTLKGTPVCELPLPASLTSCSGNVNGSDIEWTFDNGDVLDGGSKGIVSYEVTIE